MSTTLHIGTDSEGKKFTLPLDLVTQTVAILARKGKGKSYLAAVIAEELMDAGQVPVIVDPTGAHWGLKSSADGNSAGYKVVVFGGEHADVPLEDTAGAVVARAIVEHRFAAILDLSLFSKGSIHRFMAAFLETLYLLNREPLCLIGDEADLYAPQAVKGDTARVVGAMEDIVRRGRIRGIGCIMVTQRPASLNKNVLTQSEMLIALGMNHPRDIEPINEWVATHADEATAEVMIKRLPSLPAGTAWFWSPGWCDIFIQVKVRQRKTFDSGKTPKAGEKIKTPKQRAEIDVQQLGKEIASTVQRAKDNAPETLKARIRELEKQQAATPAPAKVERVEVSVVTPSDRDLLSDLSAEIKSVGSRFEELRSAILKRQTPITPSTPARIIRPFPSAIPRHLVSTPNGNEKLPRAERLILTCLAQFGVSNKSKVAAVAGYAVNGGGFNNAWCALRSQDFITAGDPADITQAGLNALGPFNPLPTGPALVSHWCAKLPKAERLILETLAAEPREWTKEELAQTTGYEATGGGFNNALGALRTLELITRGTMIRASDNLF